MIRKITINRQRGWSVTRRAALGIHRWTGWVVGAALAVVGLSGSVLVFAPELERAFDPAYRVQAGPGQRAAPSALVAAAQQASGVEGVRLIRFGAEARAPVEVWLSPVTAPRVLLHPGTAEVLSVRAADAGALGFLRELHIYLFAGDAGHTALGVLGLLMLLMSATGLVLWWPGRRKLLLGITVRTPIRGRRALFDLHKVAGIFSLPFLVLSALTGAALVFPAAAEGALDAVLRSSPEPSLPPRASPGDPLPLDHLVARADAALPGGRITRIDLPSGAGGILRLRKRLDGDAHPNGMSFVTVDPATGDILRVDNAAAARATAQVLALRYPLHIGSLGGWPVRVLTSIAGVVPAALFFTGLWLSLLRAQALRRSGQLPSSPRPSAEALPPCSP